MSESDLKYFQLLKNEISKEVRKVFPSNNSDITKWKGTEISNFQEDLENRVSGRISEKWFYTHIRGQNKSLPRVDILDLLSQYIGCENWADFVETRKIENEDSKQVKSPGTAVIIGLLSLVVLLILFATFSFLKNDEYKFCFVNAYSKRPAIENEIEIWILDHGESPYLLKADDRGCFTLNSDRKEIQFVVKSPYYKTDTIVRKLNKSILTEEVPLKVDDFALMIHIFSNANIQDWEARRVQLRSMIASDARIYQIFEKGNIGMEMYNKEEFIDKLTIPLNSLNNIEVVETTYRNEQISSLRFKQIASEIDE